MRDMCDAKKVRVVNARMEDHHVGLFTKSRDMQKLFKHAKAVLNIV